MHVEVSISTSELQEVLVAMLSEMGYEGFEQQDGLLKAYIPEADFNDEALTALTESFGLESGIARIGEKNWNEEWERSFQPVKIEGFCAVRAHFHEPITDVLHELIITPKMSFGTGHHATTFLMLKAMQTIPLNGKRVLDFGTGTGVLAVLAERLHAARVLAVDQDDWSIANARENAETNGSSVITVEKGDRVASLHGPFDVILANINKQVILDQLSDMEQQLSEGGVILLSGLFIDDAKEIENDAVRNNLSLSGRMTKDGWIALKAEKMK